MNHNFLLINKYFNIKNNYKINDNKDLNFKNKNINIKKNKYINSPKKKFIFNNNLNDINNINYNPLRKSDDQLNNKIKHNIYNYFSNPPNRKKYDLQDNINNNIFNKMKYSEEIIENNSLINTEDLLILEEKFNDIIITLNTKQAIHNACFDFWNFHFYCSFYNKIEKLDLSENESKNIKLNIKHILLSIMICYDFSFEKELFNKEYSIFINILEINYRNLILIYEYIIEKINSENKSNQLVQQLEQLVNNFNKKENINNIYKNIRQLSLMEKMTYNITMLKEKIRDLLKNYKSKGISYLTNIFKKINGKNFEEINSIYVDNILRVDNINGPVLASVFLKENKCFRTEPAPYIKTKNIKKFYLILDVDEILFHFKIDNNNENDYEGVLQIRPMVIPFLERVGTYYELIIFTSTAQNYADLIIDSIEENNLYFEHRFYRQHNVIIGNDFVKDLSRIGRPLDKIIIVDNRPQNFRFHKENGITIKSFLGIDVYDNVLEELGNILINIAKDGEDVRIGLKKYRDEIINKVAFC